MADFALGPWPQGIDGLSPETALPPGTLRAAHNVFLNRAGEAEVRPGKRRLQAVANAHSLWVSRATGLALVVVGTQLCRVRVVNGVPVRTVLGVVSGAPMRYCDLNGWVYCSDGAGLWRTDGAALVAVSLPRPVVTAIAVGGTADLRAGRGAVSVAAAYRMASGEEGPLSLLHTVQTRVGGQVAVTLAWPDDDRIAGAVLYRTPWNGEVLYRADTVAVTDGGAHTLAIGPDAESLGRTVVLHTQPMPAGAWVRYFRGHLLTASGAVLRFSRPLRYGVTDPRTDFVQFGSPVRFVEASEAPLGQPAGVFVGTGEGVFYLGGDRPKDWRLSRRGSGIPVAGSSVLVPANEFGGELGDSDVLLPVWWSDQGLGIGLPDGRVLEPHSGQVRLTPPAAGRLVQFNRRVIFGE